MFGRVARGSALIRGLTMVAVSGLIGLGCGDKAPLPLTPEELAQEAVTEAEQLFIDGKVDEAEVKAKEAEQHVPGCAKDVLAKIQANREEIQAADREKNIQELLEAGDGLLAQKKLGEAEAKYKAVLDIDKANPDAKAGLANIAEKRQPKAPKTKKEYDATNAKVDAAVRAKNYKEAIRLVRELEKYKDEGAGLKSRMGEAAGLQKKQDEADGDAAMRAGKLDEAIRKFRAAGATAKLRQAEAKKADIQKVAQQKRDYDDGMRAGQRQEKAGQLDAAVRSYQKASRSAPGARERRRAQDALDRVQRELNYRNYLAAGERALAIEDYDGAIASLGRAQSEKATPQVTMKLQAARAAKADAEADSAAAAGDIATALAKASQASSIEPTAARAQKVDDLTKKKAKADYLAKVRTFDAARKGGRLLPVLSQLEALAKANPQWKEASDLLDKGPTSAERKKNEATAAKAYAKLTKDVKNPKIAKQRTKKIALIKAAMPQVRFSSKEKLVVSMLKREMDAMLQGKYTQVTAAAKKKKGQDKINYLLQALPGFKDSSHYDKIEGMIRTERSAIKAKAWGLLTKKLATLKKAEQRKALLEQSAAEYKDTIYEKQIKSKIGTELNTIKRGEYTALNARVAKMKTPDAKIAEFQRSLPSFKGSRYEGTIKKLLSKQNAVRDKTNYKALLGRWKKQKDPQKKIQILEDGKARLSKGGKLLRKVEGLINKGKSGLEAAMYKSVSGTAAKMKPAAKKLGYLQSKAGQFKSKTYAGKIKGLIAAAKKQVATEQKQAKEAAAKKVYDTAMAGAKKAKDKAAKLQILTTAVQKVAGTRYVNMLNKEIKRLQPKKK